MAKKKWLVKRDNVGDVVIINLEHVDYIRTDLGQLKVKFANEERESQFDITIMDSETDVFIKAVAGE